MTSKIKSKKDFYSGLLFILMGLGFALVATNYPMGTAVRMGPAYFPTILGYLLALLGLIVFIESFVSADAPPTPTQLRGLLWILGSVVAFAILVGPLNAGLVPASLVIVLMSAYGGEEFRWRESLISSIIQTVAVVGIFYYGLGLPFRLFPWS